MAAAHFDVHLGLTSLTALLTMSSSRDSTKLLTQVGRLDSPVFLVTDAPQEVVTRGLHASHAISMLPEITHVPDADVKTMDNFSQIHLTKRLTYKLYNAKFCLVPHVYKVISSRISWKNAFKADL